MTTTIPSGGQLTVTVAGRYSSTKSYTQAEEITIPAGAQSLTLVGKGSSSNEVSAFLIGIGSVQIPAGTTNLKLIGKGSDGTATYDPGQPAAPGGTITLTESIAGPMSVPNTFATITIGHNGTSYTCPDMIENLAFNWSGAPRYDMTYVRSGEGVSFSELGNGTFTYDIMYVCDAGGMGSAHVRFYGTAASSAVKPQPYIAPSTTTTNGVASTMTIQGQTYTYPGGVGGPASLRTDNVS